MYLAPLGLSRVCLLAIVANITGEVLVQVVHLIMNVISVTKIIRVVSPPAKQCLALLTPVKINRLALFLSGYSTSTADNLVNNFYFAFPIPLQGPSSSITAPNFLSSQQYPHVVGSYLTKEVHVGTANSWPFDSPSISNFSGITHRDDTEKDYTPGEFSLHTAFIIPLWGFR